MKSCSGSGIWGEQGQAGMDKEGMGWNRHGGKGLGRDGQGRVRTGTGTRRDGQEKGQGQG